MNNKQDFLDYLVGKGKKQDYIKACKGLLGAFQSKLKDKSPTAEIINAFVRGRWSGYVKKDRETYQILNDYADFCEAGFPVFASAFNEHIRETFEGEARKATKTYKDAIAIIPQDTTIDPDFLGGLTNGEFVEAFKSLQEIIYAIYKDIERGSPFDWGWSDWKALEVGGLNHNRVMRILEALAGSGHVDGTSLVVDKKSFGGYGVCKPMAKAKQMLNGFMNMGFQIEGLDNKKSDIFTVSYPDTPQIIPVLFSYFRNGRNDCHCVFSYRFVEDSAAQNRETFFLAKTDGEPEQRREIYYWLYDEAVKHGFSPTGYEHMGCYLYKKGSKEWLLLGSGSSYHEDEFLHSPNYMIAAKVKFHRVFQTHPEDINKLLKRFPESVGRPWDWCFCKNSGDCKNRVMIEKDGRDYHHCCTKTYFYFHDPDFDDVESILELYKLENNIKPAK